MAKYIDKDVLVAEIEKKLDKYNKLQPFNYGAVKDLESLLNFLDTLEVKEVDLDLGSSEGDMSVKTIWYKDKIVSQKAQKGE